MPTALAPEDDKEGERMQYLLLIYGKEADWAEAPPEAQQATMAEYNDYSSWLQEKGWMRGGDALDVSTQATSVRVKNGERLVTDGPFAETKEQLGGYYLIECDNLDDAIEAAARCPGAATGTMEVRPVLEMEPLEASGSE